MPALRVQIPQVVAVAIWNFIRQLIGMFSSILAALVGVPLCEGPTVLIACMMITAASAGLFVWLQYDQFGLLGAGKRAIRSTQPLINKGIRTGAIAGATTVVFILAQCLVLMLQRALGLVIDRPMEPEVWMCPWDDTLTIVVARAMIWWLAFLSLLLFFLSMNGHFMGQDYLLKDLMVPRTEFLCLTPD